jgi:hypothetical protein
MGWQLSAYTFTLTSSNGTAAPNFTLLDNVTVF